MDATRRNDLESLLTAEEVAELLQVEPGTVRQWVKKGEIPVVKINSRLNRFRPSDLEQWIANRARAA